MIIDQDVRDRVLDPHKSFLVQAPAGSGKTTLLVKRFLNLLAIVEQDPEEIIAITFTRKAANEMRAKVLDALQAGTDPMVQRVLERDRQAGWNLLNNPARLKINTIDAFCMSIATQLPIITRFGAQPRIADNIESLYARAVDQLFISEEPTLNKLLIHLDNDRLRIKKLLISMLAMRDQWLPLVAKHDFTDQLAVSLEILQQENIAAAIDHLPDWFVAETFVDQDPSDYADWGLLAERLLTKEGTWRKRLTEAQGFPAPSAAKNKLEKQELQARKEAAQTVLEQLQECEAFRQSLYSIRMLPDPQYTDRQWEILTALTEILKLLAARLTLVFKDAGQVDYTEVLLAALRAVTQEDAIAEALHHKISHILVDEFQDTSISQYTLLEHLVANWQDDGTKTLFLVGDPMQSIYRFRQAEVSLFLQAKAQGIGRIPLHYAQLQVNFRSTAPIVGWINRVFSASFPTEDDMPNAAISYKAAIAANTNDHTVNDRNTKIKCYNTRAEAEQIIDIIQNTQPDKSIAILVRARHHLHYILPALRAANIAYQGTDLESLYARPVVQDLLALTRALLHLDDRIAWLAILRAPWLGLTLEQLQPLAAFSGTIWQALQAAQHEPFCSIMADALAARGSVALDQVVKTAWQALGGRACLTDQDQAHDSDQFFALLAQHATRREIYEPGFLEEQLQQISCHPVSVDPQAVQILTMHKAKGLEFDVVIIPGLARTPRMSEQKLLLLERRKTMQDYLLVAPVRAASAEQDSLYNYLAWCEKQRQTHEDLRLLYVAVTRAREQLYCLADCETEPATQSLLAAIWPAVQDEFVATKTPATARTVTQHSVPALQRLPQAWHRIQPYTQQIITATARPHWHATSEWQRLVGTVVHRALWHLATHGSANMPDWVQYARHLGVPLEHEHFIKTAVQNILRCQHAKQILSRDYAEAYAEWELSMQVDGTARQIKIDRAYLDQDQVFWIVDYKMVFNDHELDISTYHDQLNTYINAVQKFKPDARIKAALYFPLQGKLIASQI